MTGTTQPGPGPLTAELAEFASGLSWEQIPESARHAARRTFVNVVGLAVDASRHDAVEIAVATLGDLGLRGRSSVLGRADTLTAAWAAFVNGMAMHVEDFDDTHLRTVIHPGSPVVPAALAVAELTNASGRDLLTAVTAGVEVACRVGNALGPGHFDRGWHLTGTMGHLGAAVAAGRLLGLDATRMRHAVSLAATQAAGTTEQLGTMSKSMHPGKAAADGVEAALLAAAGFTGPDAPLEGRRGLAALLAPEPDLAEATRELGRAWEIEANAFKPYSCGIVSHPVIDAAIELRDILPGPEVIESVDVVVRPVVLEVMGVEEPEDGLRSKFSVYHCFAVGFLDGGAGPAQYSDARARDESVIALRRKVRASIEPTMPKDACEVTVRTTGGTTHRVSIAHATGSVDRPMSDERLRAKFDLLVRPRLGDRAAALWRTAWHIDECDGIGNLFGLSRW
ncbi:MmgE/PrpD family protein [Micromonospora sp. NBC_01405]|uniref:MmgE/PrpD family protein n=1 Tax=Micromonospora sp. NBC_01405 TaxID=2903589 RepID=UPI00324F91BC